MKVLIMHFPPTSCRFITLASRYSPQYIHCIYTTPYEIIGYFSLNLIKYRKMLEMKVAVTQRTGGNGQ
jgi:hypothetical protein